MNRPHWLHYALCALVVAGPASAARLSGRVTDYGTNEGIGAVKVVVALADEVIGSASTDADGQYAIDDLPSDVDLVASYRRAGYLRRPTVKEGIRLTEPGDVVGVELFSEKASSSLEYLQRVAESFAERSASASSSAEAEWDALQRFGLDPAVGTQLTSLLSSRMGEDLIEALQRSGRISPAEAAGASAAGPAGQRLPLTSSGSSKRARTWHGAYSRHFLVIEAALSALADQGATAGVCDQLRGAVVEAEGSRKLHRAPDAEVERKLKTAMQALKVVVGACGAGDENARFDDEVNRARRELVQLSTAADRYWAR